MNTTDCPDCGHQHVGADFGGVCIGCPCPTRSAAWLADLAYDDGDDCAPSPVLVEACTRASRAIAEVLALAPSLLRPAEVEQLQRAQAIAHALPFDDR
jgi:hypothetical protein